eukprot:1162034-Pelagomonas_calceolata.AAC.1
MPFPFMAVAGSKEEGAHAAQSSCWYAWCPPHLAHLVRLALLSTLKQSCGGQRRALLGLYANSDCNLQGL